MPSRLTGTKIIKINEKPSPSTNKAAPVTKQPTPSKQLVLKVASNNTPAKSPSKVAEKTPVKQEKSSPRLQEKSNAKQQQEKQNKQQQEKVTTLRIKPAEKAQTPNKKTADQQTNKNVSSPSAKIIQIKPGSPKKKLTEVDKLLMDEGAVKMLYAVKTEDSGSTPTSKKRKQQSVISLDLAEEELKNKTNEILNDLQQNSSSRLSTISLRKKETVPVVVPPKKSSPATVVPGGISRQKSKDSTRSSIQSPPASPVFHGEASRIIRRHSSDSFSSDGDEEEKDKSEQRVVTRRSKAGTDDKRKQNEEMSKKFNKLIETDQQVKIELNECNTISLFYHVDLLHVVISAVNGKVYLTAEVIVL